MKTRLRGGAMTRRKPPIKTTFRDIDEMIKINMNKPVVRATTTRKRANKVKQAIMDSQEAKEGTNFSYAFRDYMARKEQQERSRIGRNPSPNKTRRRSRSRSRRRSRSKSIRRSRSRSRSRSMSKSKSRSMSRSMSRSRSRSRSRRFDPYDDSSEFNQLIKDNASLPIVRNKMGPTSVKQSKYDTEGTYSRPFG